MLLISGVAYAIISNYGEKSTATGSSSTPQTTSKTPEPTSEKPTATKPTATSEKPPPSQTKPPSQTPSSKPPATKFTPAQVTQFVKQHYAKLPGNVAGARADWDQNQAPSEAGEKTFWGKYSKVVIKEGPLTEAGDDGTFTVTTALELTDKETNDPKTAEHVLTISGKGEKLLITGEERN